MSEGCHKYRWQSPDPLVEVPLFSENFANIPYLVKIFPFAKKKTTVELLRRNKGSLSVHATCDTTNPSNFSVTI